VDDGLLDLARLFEEDARDALDSLPPDLRAQMSNVEIVAEEEPPPGQRLLGLYQGVPLTKRSSQYGGVLPDKITVYRGPLVRLYGHDSDGSAARSDELSSTRSPTTSGSATSA
jgi:predicted Zn-dependent protease with MMP-like domain